MTLDPEPLIHFEPNFRWRNKHRNVEGVAARLYNVWNRTSDGQEPARRRFVAGLNALRQIVLDAEGAGKRVRAYGGAWSLSDAAWTDDYLVNTKPLNYLSLGLTADQVLAGESARAPRLVFAQCGVHVMELYTALEGAGLTLPTSGASNGQTFAGAVSTGTHGAALHVGSMQDFVRGIHLVVEGGRHLYVERASAPLVSDRFVDILGAELCRDDALFEAALVSFGSFGIIHGLLFEAVPLYDLLKHRFRVDHERALERFDLEFPRLAADHGLPPAIPDHFEITFDPYRPGQGEQGAYVTTMYRLSPQTTAAATSKRGGFEPGDDVLHLLGTLTNLTGAPVPLLVSQLAEAQLTPVSGKRATPGKTFSRTNVRGDVMSAELGIPLSRAAEAVRAIAEEARKAHFPGLVAARFVKASSATLAFTRFSPRHLHHRVARCRRATGHGILRPALAATRCRRDPIFSALGTVW